jgi:hypothetical protein
MGAAGFNYTDPDAGAESDLALEPMGEELLEVLEEIMPGAEVMENLEQDPIDSKWPQKALRQATKVSYMALEVCDPTTKADWDSCAYTKNRWRLEQEVRWLNSNYDGLEEKDAPVYTRKRART